MRRLSTAVLVLFTACSKDAALKLVVTTAPERPDTCFEVKVNAGDSELGNASLVRSASDDEYSVAIYQGSNFPDDVELNVQAWVGDGGCAEPRVANGALKTSGHFSNGVTTVEARLETLADSDGDQAVASSAGGADCDDTDAQRSPFFTENCSQPVDRDCDGFLRCTDSDCTGACHGVAAVLVFTNQPITVRQGACSNALRLEARDAFGTAVALPSGLTLSGSGVAFSAAPECNGPAPDAVPIGGLAVYARASQAGSVMITASASGLTSATQELNVLALPSLELVPAASNLYSTVCLTQAVQLRDIDGGLFTSGGSVDITFDAGTQALSLFDNCTNLQPRSSITLSGVPSIVFGLTAPRAGLITITANADGFMPGSVTYYVQAGPAYAVTIDAGANLFAATCNPITATWTDDAGNPAVPSSVAVSAGMQLFNDANCSTQVAPQPTSTFTFYGWPADEGDYPLTIDGGAAPGEFTLHAVRPFPPGAALEIPLTVTTGGNAPFNGYDGYSTLVIIDGGAPLPDDLSLLRTYFWGASGWSEIDRVYGGYGAGSWQFWFRSQTDLPNSAADNHYAFFVMNPGSLPAKASEHNVWLFDDDFESGLGKWNDGGTQWGYDTNNGHSGTGSLINYGNDAGGELTIGLATALNEKDVSIQSYWKSPDLPNVNAAQELRVQPPNGAVTWVAHELNKASSGWRFATYSDATTYTAEGGNITSGPASTSENGWYLVLLRMCGGDLDGQMPSGYGTRHLGNPLGAGSVGFRSSGVTHAPLSIDDVVVRRFACPEPVTYVLPPRASP